MEAERSATPVDLAGVGRDYGSRRALAGLDLRLEPGEVVAVVGPNGSGKTTLLKIVCGLLRTTRGTARVFGADPFTERARVLRRARFVLAPPALLHGLTGREHVRHLAALRPRRARAIEPREVDAALERVGLLQRADERAESYSYGMRQRLALAQAIVPAPDLLVLDEPTDGLDPLAVQELIESLASLRDEHGMAILTSSHLLARVGELADRLLVLDEGQRVFLGSPDELCAGTSRVRLRVDRPERAQALLTEHGLSPRRDGDQRIELPAGSIELERAAVLLREAGLRLESYACEPASLEDALLAHLRRGPARGTPGEG